MRNTTTIWFTLLPGICPENCIPALTEIHLHSCSFIKIFYSFKISLLVCICILVNYAHVTMHVWWSEDSLGIQSVFSTLFGISSFAVYGSSDFCKFPTSKHRRSEVADVCYLIQLHEGSEVPNTGPYTCKANHLPNEFSPQFSHLSLFQLFL